MVFSIHLGDDQDDENPPDPDRTFSSLVIDNFTRALVGPAVVGHAAERGLSRWAETARMVEFGAGVDRDLPPHRPHPLHAPTF